MCRVTFIACGVPSFYDLDLVCEVGDRFTGDCIVTHIQLSNKCKQSETLELYTCMHLKIVTSEGVSSYMYITLTSLCKEHHWKPLFLW